MAKRGDEWAERDAAVNWCIATVAISCVAFFVLAIASFALSYLIGKGISQETISTVWKFLKRLALDPMYLGQTYWRWIKQLYNYTGGFSIPLYLPMLCLFRHSGNGADHEPARMDFSNPRQRTHRNLCRHQENGAV